MFEDIVNSGETATLTLYGKYRIPAWAVIQYCKDTIDTAMKLTSIVNMCKLIDRGKAVFNFAIENRSKDLYPIIDNSDLQKREFSYNNIIKLGRNDDTSYKFWYLFKKLERPNILVRENDRWFPIYNSEYPTAIQIRKIIVESPPLFSFEGLAEVINSLRYAAEKEEREKITWRNEERYKETLRKIEIITRVINLENILNNSNTDDGCRSYAKEMIYSLIIDQEQRNDLIGIEKKHIDIKA